MPLIPISKSIIIACDVDVSLFEQILNATHDIPEVGAYKIGASLALTSCGKLKSYRSSSGKPFIYDHQKAGTDPPRSAKLFARACRENLFDAVILFPFAGPDSLESYVVACKENGLEVIVGGRMTKPKFLASEGGFIDDNAPVKIYHLAAKLGVKNYVVPGNRPLDILFYKSIVKKIIKEDPVLFSPGFGIQGGSIYLASFVENSNIHFIVGESIYSKPDIRKAALEYVREL